MLTWTDSPRPYETPNGAQWWPVVNLSSDSPTDKIQGAMFGQRSDGDRFFAMMLVGADASEDEKRQAVVGATEKLNKVLTCGCYARQPCDKHRPAEASC